MIYIYWQERILLESIKTKEEIREKLNKNINNE